MAGKRVFERKFVFSSDFLRKLAISGSGGPISGSGSGFWLENVFLSDFLGSHGFLGVVLGAEKRPLHASKKKVNFFPARIRKVAPSEKIVLFLQKFGGAKNTFFCWEGRKTGGLGRITSKNFSSTDPRGQKKNVRSCTWPGIFFKIGRIEWS